MTARSNNNNDNAVVDMQEADDQPKGNEMTVQYPLQRQLETAARDLSLPGEQTTFGSGQAGQTSHYLSMPK